MKRRWQNRGRTVRVRVSVSVVEEGVREVEIPTVVNED